MSSELFENYEAEYSNLVLALNKKINSQIPNYSGEQRKSALRAANKDVERAEDLIREMDMETRSAPPAYRTKLTGRLREYQAEMQKLKKELASVASGGDRSELLGGAGGAGVSNPSFEGHVQGQRSRLLRDQDTLNRTSDRIASAQRIGEESEQIGAGVLSELGTQRDTIIRVGTKVTSTDANLSKSRRILNSMSRRVMTNKLIMFAIVFILCCIIGIELFFKLK